MIDACPHCEKGCSVCAQQAQFLEVIASANIPTAYWFLRMKEFQGAPSIKTAVVDYVKNMPAHYENGEGICFEGTPGTGKTYGMCSILKSALRKDYTVYYTTFSELVFYLSEADAKIKSKFYHTVTRADFLCIDEVDSRHFSDSDQSFNFFGRAFERIIRYRTQNNLPILLATNEASITDAFRGQFKKFVESLLAPTVKIIPALGKDFRTQEKV